MKKVIAFFKRLFGIKDEVPTPVVTPKPKPKRKPRPKKPSGTGTPHYYNDKWNQVDKSPVRRKPKKGGSNDSLKEVK
jgi:hypothetical protein